MAPDSVTIRMMARLNLTLDADTLDRLERHANSLGRARASAARDLLVGALDRVERLARLEQLARDYASDRDDAALLLAEIEAGQVGMPHD
jgi:hypothetical protein